MPLIQSLMVQLHKPKNGDWYPASIAAAKAVIRWRKSADWGGGSDPERWGPREWNAFHGARVLERELWDLMHHGDIMRNRRQEGASWAMAERWDALGLVDPIEGGAPVGQEAGFTPEQFARSWQTVGRGRYLSRAEIERERLGLLELNGGPRLQNQNQNQNQVQRRPRGRGRSIWIDLLFDYPDRYSYK
jgi:hypothetical protein